MKTEVKYFNGLWFVFPGFFGVPTHMRLHYFIKFKILEDFGDIRYLNFKSDVLPIFHKFAPKKSLNLSIFPSAILPWATSENPTKY